MAKIEDLRTRRTRKAEKFALKAEQNHGFRETWYTKNETVKQTRRLNKYIPRESRLRISHKNPAGYFTKCLNRMYRT